jgi:hypothetical protein
LNTTTQNEQQQTIFSLETLERYSWKSTTFLSRDDDDDDDDDDSDDDDTSNMSQNTKRSTTNDITTKIDSSSGGIQTYVTIVHLGSDVATSHPCLYLFSLFYSALPTTETLTFAQLIGARAALQLQL